MHRYRSRRSAKRLAQKSKRNFFITIIIIGALFYTTLNWFLPNFIGSIGTIKSTLAPDAQIVKTQKISLAPPVLNIPFEATNSSTINIKGYGAPKSKVKIFIDDKEKAKVEVSEDGSFTAENIELGIGTNNIFGETLDEEGNKSLPSKTIRLIYTFEKPKLTVNQPEDNKTIQGGEKKITVSGKTDPGVKIYINQSQTVVDKDGNFTLVLEINEGDNTITIRALDTAGNSTEIQRKVTFSP